MVVIVPMLPPKAPAPNHPPTPLNQVHTPGHQTHGRIAGAHGALARTAARPRPAPSVPPGPHPGRSGHLIDRRALGHKMKLVKRLLRPEPRQHVDPWQTMTRRVPAPENDRGPRGFRSRPGAP